MGREPLAPGRWGTITRRELDKGRWLAVATFRDYSGATHRPNARGRSAEAAQRALEAKLHRLAEQSAGPAGTADITPDTRMSVVFDQWALEKRAEGRARPQSMDSYLGTLERNLRPALGNLRVREVTPVAVNRVLVALVSARKYDTARQSRNVLMQCMALCVRYGAAPFNPVRDAVTVRKPRREEVRTLSLPDVARLREAVRAWEDREPTLRGKRNITLLPQIVDTMLGTGLRIGEALALRAVDLDLDGDPPTLTVAGTVTRAEVVADDGSVQRRLMRQAKPKSDSSRRTIPLPGFVVDALREALDLGLDGGPDGLVFPSIKGTPRSPSRVREQLRQAREGTGLDMAPHDLRRTVASLVVAQTRSVADAKDLLGHADEGTTTRHYVNRTNLAPDLRVVLDLLLGGDDERKK